MGAAIRVLVPDGTNYRFSWKAESMAARKPFAIVVPEAITEEGKTAAASGTIGLGGGLTGMARPISWLILGGAALAVAVAVYLGLRFIRPEPLVGVAPPAIAPSVPPAPSEPKIRYPVKSGDTPVPAIEQSDAALGDAVAALLSDKSLAAFFNVNAFVRRVVATVDNLPREKVARHVMPIKPVAAPFLTAGRDESAVISRDNAARYAAYVRIVEAVDPQRLVAFYSRYYPLFQQAYRELGYPNGYFNDRLVEAIDSLLAAPDAREPVRLVRPKVFYQFADPALEALPAGQKILIRIGSANAAKVKWKLREIRSELVSQAPKPEQEPADGAPVSRGRP